MRALGIVALSTLFSASAMAASGADPNDVIDDASLPDEVIYAKVTEHKFDEVNVNAASDGPSIGLVLEPRRLVFPPAFRLREHFAVEMRQSVDFMK
jgi:hypothetical protein